MAKFVIAGEEFELVATDDLLFAEARAIQKATGVSLGSLIDAEGDVDAIQGLVWVSMKRRRPEMKFSDLDGVKVSSIEWIDDDEVEGVKADPTPGE